MIAHRLALTCLIFLVPSWAQHTAAQERVAVVLVSALPDDSPALTSMKSSLNALMREAGVDIVMGSTGEVFDGDVIVLKLRGSCDTPRPDRYRAPLENLTSLASTASSDGKILPFTSVDCEALERFIGDDVAALQHRDRAQVYGRAIARLAAHELYHVLTNEKGHTDEGLAKAGLSRKELTTGEALGLGRVLAHRNAPVPAAAHEAWPQVVHGLEPPSIYEGK